MLFNKAIDFIDQKEFRSSIATTFRAFASKLNSLLNVCFTTSGRLEY